MTKSRHNFQPKSSKRDAHSTLTADEEQQRAHRNAHKQAAYLEDFQVGRLSLAY